MIFHSFILSTKLAVQYSDGVHNNTGSIRRSKRRTYWLGENNFDDFERREGELVLRKKYVEVYYYSKLD
jgi:hypothetical protein